MAVVCRAVAARAEAVSQRDRLRSPPARRRACGRAGARPAGPGRPWHRCPAGTRRLTTARASPCTAAVTWETGGQSMASTVAAGRAHRRSATARPAGQRGATPSSSAASSRKRCPRRRARRPRCRRGRARRWSSPPSASRRLASAVSRAWSASGAAPPYMPGVGRVRHRAHRHEDAAGAAQRGGQGRHARARRCRCRRGRRRRTAPARGGRGPAPPCRRWTAPPTPRRRRRPRPATPPSTSRRARRASRVATRLPLQSAEPLPYQRPSRSVSSHGGVDQAAGRPTGTTSWWE